MNWIVLHAPTATSRRTAQRVALELPRVILATPERAAALHIRPAGVLVDAAALRVERVAHRLHVAGALGDAPLVALVAHATEGAVLEAMEGGADDVVPAGDHRALAGIRLELEALARRGTPITRARRVTPEPPSSSESEQRVFARVPHETLCSYRADGEMWPRFASTWDLSERGLFVRTLAPPAPGADLWLELRPPGRRRARQLRGVVVWRSRPTEPVGPQTPAGFGVRLIIEACPPADADAFVQSARELARSQRRAA